MEEMRISCLHKYFMSDEGDGKLKKNSFFLLPNKNHRYSIFAMNGKVFIIILMLVNISKNKELSPFFLSFFLPFFYLIISISNYFIDEKA
jgi:hypothetical protein